MSELPADDDIVVEMEASHGPAGVGRVIAAGARAANLLDKRVLVGPINPCGECEVCRRGGAPVCPLARRRETLASPVTVAARWVVALDDGLELATPLAAHVPGDIALAYTLYARTNLAPREPVVVTGAGPVARFLVQILVAKGIAPTLVVEAPEAASAELADWARARGVAVAVVAANDAGEVDDANAIEAVRATFAAQAIGNRPWRVLATSPAATLRAAGLAGPRATLTVLAGSPDLPAALVEREVTILTVARAHPDLVVEVAALCVKGEISL